MGVLDSIIQAMRRTGTTQAASSVPYGPPSIEQHIGRPVIYGPTPHGQEGEFIPSNPLMTLVGQDGGGTLYVDPARAGTNLPLVAQHEAVHALFQDTPRDLVRLWGPTRRQQLLGSAADAVQPAVEASRAVNGGPDAAADEALAYTAAYQPGQVPGLTPLARKAALDQVLQNMPKLYPAATAAAYRRLITKP